jgi:hypothetical protein
VNGATWDACSVTVRARQTVTCFRSGNKWTDCVVLFVAVWTLSQRQTRSVVGWFGAAQSVARSQGILVGRWKGNAVVTVCLVMLVCVRVAGR